MTARIVYAAAILIVVLGAVFVVAWLHQRGHATTAEETVGWQIDRVPSAWKDPSMPPTQFLVHADLPRRLTITLSGVVIFRGVIDTERQDYAREVRLAAGKYDILVQDAESGETANASIDTRAVRTVEITLSPPNVAMSDHLLEPL